VISATSAAAVVMAPSLTLNQADSPRRARSSRAEARARMVLVERNSAAALIPRRFPAMV
jgi:hypothetical protein